LSIERHIAVSRSELTDLTEALAWAVQQHDLEFTAATMVKIHVEQIMSSTTPGQWEYSWTAAVSGLIEEEDR
jgi:hypothetical protein